MRKRSLCVRFCVLIAIAACLTAGAWAQSLVAGDIVGTVTDPSNAVIPNVVVNLKSLDTGAALTAKTNATGAFHFSLLKPGTYQVSVSESGFAAYKQTTTVAVGVITTANIPLKVSANATVVEVTSEATLISPEPGSTTSFTQQQMQLLPSPGADITNIAQTAPGASMNTAGGNQYGGGNFTINGLPGVSNLFTVNGENDMDPYFNVNNSGATNLTLGQNEISEAAVITNAYSGQYGQLSGAQVTYVTKSGSNQYHGNAQWWWNGDYVNANDWMNKNGQLLAGQPNSRSFSNDNQWATSAGGPIIKNKTFFFADYEGVRFILPTIAATGSPVITVPTPAFANAVLANLATTEPGSVPLYTKMFNLYSAAAAGKTGSPTGITGCSGLTLPGFVGTGTNCAMGINSVPSALGKEWILAARADQRIGNSDTLYYRYKMDHGTQPTLEDQVSPAFSANSNQPSWDMQINETHIFSPRSTNQFMVTGSYYSALFAQQQPLANDTFPASVFFAGLFTQFNFEFNFPQGRKLTQYQIVDDYSLTLGKHNLKFGENFRRYLISDHNFTYLNPFVFYTDLGAFTNGLAFEYNKAYSVNTDVPIKMWGLGMYAQDDWAVSRNLKLTLALRLEHYGNPVCGTNCFSNFVAPWASLPSVVAGVNGGDVPYNQDIRTGVSNAFSGVDGLNASPRIGFSWSPRGKESLVVSGGFGIFYDGPPSGLLDNLTQDPPNYTRLAVAPPSGTPALDNTASGSAATWQASANAFSAGFAHNGTFNSISAALSPLGVSFAAPNFTALVGTFHSPRYYEWNLQVQKEIRRGTVVILNYVGNKGENIPYQNEWLNAYQQGLYQTALVPTAAPNPNYGTIAQWQSGAISNYNGLNVSLREQFSNQLSFHLNYTWGHNLDEISNGGATINNASSLYSSITNQINPNNLRQYNYGNSDYDIRNTVNFDWVYTPTVKLSNHLLSAAANGWQWAGKAFFRSGLPFSIIDGNYTGDVFNGGAQGFNNNTGPGQNIIMAQPIPGNPQANSCGQGNAGGAPTGGSCLLSGGFVNTLNAGYSAFSTQERNQYRGPHYIDFDMGLNKNFNVFESLKFGMGMQVFNVFNHANFNIPLHDISTGSSFGTITSMAPLPTTPYGSGLGFSSTGRLVQLTLKMTF